MTEKRKRRCGAFRSWLTGRELDVRNLPPEPAAEDEPKPIPLEGPPPAAEATAPDQRPCPICGRGVFHWGWLESGLYGTGKGSAAPPPQPKYVKQKTRFGDYIGLRARLCDNCGHVDVFATDAEQE